MTSAGRGAASNSLTLVLGLNLLKILPSLYALGTFIAILFGS